MKEWIVPLLRRYALWDSMSFTGLQCRPFRKQRGSISAQAPVNPARSGLQYRAGWLPAFTGNAGQIARALALTQESNRLV